MSAEDHKRLPDGYVTTWWSTEPLGNFKSLTAVTAGPAAIVAAFSIAGVVAVLARDHVEFLDAAAALLFSAAAFVLFDLLLAAVDASAVSVTPEERLDWFPEGKKDKRILTPLRHRQLHDFAAFIYYSDRIKVLYRVGLFLALTGLASLMLARRRRRPVRPVVTGSSDGVPPCGRSAALAWCRHAPPGPWGVAVHPHRSQTRRLCRGVAVNLADGGEGSDVRRPLRQRLRCRSVRLLRRVSWAEQREVQRGGLDAPRRRTCSTTSTGCVNPRCERTGRELRARGHSR